MARRTNELFIGTDFLTFEGRGIKHHGVINEFGVPNINKISTTRLELAGIDLETDYKTSELKLFGTYNEGIYKSHTSGFLGVLFELVQSQFWKKDENGKKVTGALAYWNKLDPFVLYKQFLLLFDEEKQDRSMARFGKVSGEWNSKEGKWSISPVIEIEVKRGLRVYRFGIKNVIRSSVQFYFYELVGGMPKQLNNESYPLSIVWAFDIATLFKNGLEREALGKVDEETGLYPNARLPYYSKLGDEYHKVDWDRFDSDPAFRQGVLYSNELDARAVYDLGIMIQEQFKRAFHFYPKNLISSGSIARSSIVATLTYKYRMQISKEMTELWCMDVPMTDKRVTKKADKLVREDIKSIGIMNFYDKWSKQITNESLKDMFCLLYEAYSGGYIEAMLYGIIKKGAYSDIASAYIKYITELLDLRDSEVTTGIGTPPHIKNSYCVIRGTVNIPLEVNYMPITVKHVINLSTNVRATGEYKGSYYLEERDYMLTQGATFTDESWYNVETKGILSPIALIATDFTSLRTYLLSINDSAEYMAKSSSASLYGIMYEATDTFKEDDNLEITREGYRGGEFLNPLYAGWITCKTRIQISEASVCIVNNGGRPGLLMTDCIFWEGKPTDLDDKFIRHKKTLGYFETPVEFSEMALLGTGRYTFIDSKEGLVTTKNRGLNITEIHNPDGVEVGITNWIDALKIAEKNNSFKLKVGVRRLISVGLILHNKNDKFDEDGNLVRKAFTVKDLGLIIDETTEIDLVTGLTKRLLVEPLNDIKDITRGNISTKSIYYSRGMLGDGKLVDQTLPKLRNEVMKLDVKTARSRSLQTRSKASHKYSKKNVKKILTVEQEKYQMLKALGYSRDECKLWCKRGYDRINNELLGGKKDDN